jgi:hypothetical protein
MGRGLAPASENGVSAQEWPCSLRRKGAGCGSAASANSRPRDAIAVSLSHLVRRVRHPRCKAWRDLGASRFRLPAVYPFRYHVASGGLSYGPDTLDLFRRGASYVDGILRGENPAALPVQTPSKFELVINLKTAKVLGMEIQPLCLPVPTR